MIFKDYSHPVSSFRVHSLVFLIIDIEIKNSKTNAKLTHKKHDKKRFDWMFAIHKEKDIWWRGSNSNPNKFSWSVSFYKYVVAVRVVAIVVVSCCWCCRCPCSCCCQHCQRPNLTFVFIVRHSCAHSFILLPNFRNTFLMQKNRVTRFPRTNIPWRNIPQVNIPWIQIFTLFLEYDYSLITYLFPEYSMNFS